MDGVSRRYKRRAQLWTTLLAGAITLGANADSVRWRALCSRVNKPPMLLDGTEPLAVCLAAWPQSIVGWVLTAAAVSLGAPFWFDVARNLAAATRPQSPRGYAAL